MGHKINPNNFRSIIFQNYLSIWYADKQKYNFYLQEDFFIRTMLSKIFRNYLDFYKIKIIKNNNKIKKKNCINILVSTAIPLLEDISLFFFHYFKKCKLNKKLKKKILHIIDSESNNFEKNTINIEINISEIMKIIKITLKLIKFFFIKFLTYLSKIIQIQYSKKIFIKLNFTVDIFEDIELIGQYIADLLKNRISIRKILHEIMVDILLTDDVEHKLNILGLKIIVAGRHDGYERSTIEKYSYGKMAISTFCTYMKFLNICQKTVYGTFGIKIWISQMPIITTMISKNFNSQILKKCLKNKKKLAINYVST